MHLRNGDRSAILSSKGKKQNHQATRITKAEFDAEAQERSSFSPEKLEKKTSALQGIPGKGGE